jgi:hypothetical protein
LKNQTIPPLYPCQWSLTWLHKVKTQRERKREQKHIPMMFAGARGIQWAASPADNSVLYACSRGTLSLPWTLLLAAGDVIEDVKWFFSGRSQEIMAADVNGVFVPLPAYSGRVTKTTNAGLDVSHVQQLDSGNYSVEVLARTAAGDLVTLWRSA